MRNFFLICGLLLHMVFAPSANAISASISATDGVAGAAPGFDYDQALKVSQGALGNQLGNYRFTDTDGSVVTLDQLRGKPLVLSMIFTSCYQICPMTTRHLSKIVQKARDALLSDMSNDHATPVEDCAKSTRCTGR
jgi:protein SCO1/2